ncbi:MAG: nuclear transport factor 2 family protein [Terriglobia bacterium]
MKIRIGALVLGAVLAAGAAGPAAAPSAEEEILVLTRELLENIYVHPSADFYAAHVDSEVTAYEGLPTRMDGLEFHLHAVREFPRMLVREGEVRRLELLNPKVQLYGDAAIVTFTSHVTVLHEDEVRTELLNETRVWVRRDSQWKLVHFHKSPVHWPPED